MKIATDAYKQLIRSGSALGLLLAIGVGNISPVLAAETGPLTPLPAPPTTATDSASSVALPAPIPGTAASRAKNLNALEEKVSDSIKNVVKQLGATDNINLDDLNTARQAVAKLDIMIDIEKRFAELEKVRGDRNGEKSIAAAIPASALAIPQSMRAVNAKTITSEASSGQIQPMSLGHNEVSKISGADGHYVATVQGKNFRVGDTLPDGSKIVSISARHVDTKSKSGATKQLNVKGIEAVFGDTL
jgi:hypothetical protein